SWIVIHAVLCTDLHHPSALCIRENMHYYNPFIAIYYLVSFLIQKVPADMYQQGRNYRGTTLIIDIPYMSISRF
ncbi:hypothetical protein, partial [Terribacillus saccharophilus]|uniref:hypothetical protein n=1 Tax=Terribacillus saccharophilus TaxID=361277 RepID=UPI001C3EC771